MGESGAVIRVENLSKRYVISHAAERGRYSTLRDSLAGGLKSLGGRLLCRATTDNPRREEFWALRDVSFEVKRGEVVGIIGRNGAGKSTLLKVLSRITEPTSGRIEIDGRVASLLEVGTGFHPELTGRENVYLNGAILGMTRAEIRRKFDEIVAFAEVEKFLDTPVKRYSSGMYMRLAFAVAAHLEPEILIVDEVLAVGDAAFQKKCLGKMSEVAKGGRTVLFVSHNMAAVGALCSAGCLLNAGRVSFAGPIDECLACYSRVEGTADRSRYERLTPASGQNCWVRVADVFSAEGGFQPIGSPLVLRIEAVFDRPTRFPKIGFVLSTAAGDKLLNANNTYQPFENSGELVRSGVFLCECGTVPLLPGVYSLSIWLGDELGDHDALPDCLYFEVTEGDTWGTGRQPPRNAGSMYWPTHFSFEPQPREVIVGS